ncbi:hypothetical protein QBC40DRAFT_105910 [Triangularia verruculosa]|uniref:SWR1-complex protein 3 domain-containing protein n=1 Tax=Triangularia verruculosa TaxID=2587418 RepID=A0AAN6XF10_9PEZI|nr:hypothetical protein QBC40DRAFT_105910 [Triangularia verruculosa]
MEKKRKLPARAAARVEQAAKRRNIDSTPKSVSKSATPTPAPAAEPEPTPVEDIPTPLPKSISAGKPLPTVDSPQPNDLSNKDYQSVTESAVLSESLARSRQQWMSEAIFPKYWSKPIKKKGQIIEEPNNPSKASMVKLGPVTIIVEPHSFEATMYSVKDPKPPPPPPITQRPVLQYGPPNGIMPPPATPKIAKSAETSSPAPTPVAQPSGQAPAQPKAPSQPRTQTQTPAQTPTLPTEQPTVGIPQGLGQSPAPNPPLAPEISRLTPTIPAALPRPVASPRGMESVLSPGTVIPQPPARPHVTTPLGIQPPRLPPSPNPTLIIGTGAAAFPAGHNPALAKPPINGAPAAPGAAAPGKPAPGTDPIILMLASRAGTDAELRDLMKRVANGEATKQELTRFQAIIDAITAENKRSGSTTGPSAERLLIDGRTVKYFADEVKAILDIVLTSNAKQTSADLRPPNGCDPLIVALVKKALDDIKTREMVRRVSENKTQFSDATDLKLVIDSLRTMLKEKEAQPLKTPTSATTPIVSKQANGVNGSANNSASSTPAPQPAPQPQQALRSKGPPPPPKPDISAVVFEVAGGNGDRYMFPKFSILEQMAMAPGAGQQVVASFLVVRRGSKSEYPQADPDQDYYEPLTVRLFTPTGRHLENLFRVVAPQEEVRRYMEGIMETMTRSEYVLLAMRLPRRDGTETEDTEMAGISNGTAKEKDAEVEEREKKSAHNTPSAPQVLWATNPPKIEMTELSSRSRGSSKHPKVEMQELTSRSRGVHNGTEAADEDAQYQSFIATVAGKASRE